MHDRLHDSWSPSCVSLRANAVEEDDPFFDEGGGAGWENLDYQGGGLFRNTLPWEEGAGVNHGNASGQVHSIGYSFLKDGRTGGEDGD